MRVSLYTEQDAVEWDEFLARAPMATFLHTRRYLSYHGERIKDASLLVRDEHDKLLGLFPAAIDHAGGEQVISHPGITFGGILHDGRLRGERMLEAVCLLKDYYAARGFETILYKAIPYIYHQVPSADDLYAIFRCGGTRYRCDLASVVDLANRPGLNSRRKRGLKRAINRGVQITEGDEHIESLWAILEDNLARKYGAKPVHSMDQINHLHALFPHHIKFVAALLDTQAVAGAVLFCSPQVVKAQYIASSPIGNEVCALDAIFEHCIEQANFRGARYFDFGTSNQNEGQYLNDSLYQFKTEFGAGGVAHEFYRIDVRECRS